MKDEVKQRDKNPTAVAGGLATKKKYKRKHYVQMGVKSGEARRGYK